MGRALSFRAGGLAEASAASAQIPPPSLTSSHPTGPSALSALRPLQLCLCFVPEVCTLPKEPGSCTLDLDYFYYDSSTQTCERFLFSGCKGNANRFYTQEECLQVCGETGA